MFSKNSRAKDGLQYACKPCSNLAGRENYVQNKERYFKHATAQHQRKKDKLRALKEVPCADCGVQYPWYVMDFDHLGDKEFNLSHMIRRRMRWELIEAEIAKCEVVCSNCHRARSYERWTAKPWKNQWGEG